MRLIKLDKSGSCSGLDKNTRLRIIVVKANTSANSVVMGRRTIMLLAYNKILITITVVSSIQKYYKMPVGIFSCHI